MSDLFDEEPEEPGPRRPGRRARALVITGAVVLLGFFALTTFASIYTDRLWYREVGYTSVWSTMLWTRVGLFLVFGVLMGVAVAVNMHLAYRFRPLFRMPGGDGSVDRYRDAITPIRTWLLLGVSVVIGIFAGTSAVGQWRTFLLWRHGHPFDQTDKYFHRDIGFYVFDLPWWHYLVDFVMALAVVALLATAVVHYLYGGIRLQVQHDRLSGAAQVQFSVLLGIFVLAKAVDYYLDRFDLVTSDHDKFTGMNYTGENALLPARNILMGVALICALLFFLNVWRRTWQLPSVGLALLALSAILLGMIWPAIVQGFQVKPSEADKESPYIKANIDATRAAFDIDDVETEPFRGTPSTTEAEGEDLQGQLTHVPVVDPQQVRQTFEQRQQRYLYYSVPPVLDVDHYEIPGEGDKPLVLGVRELDQDGIDSSDRNWSNLHTVYTHGEGIIAAYADQVVGSADSNGDRIVWAEGLGPSAHLFSGPDRDQIENRIYFGEDSPSYSVVGKASEDSPSVELGLDLSGDEDSAQETTTTYDGKGGVPIGSTFNQLMYAVKFGEANFLLSGRVNDNSKVLYNRKPVDRVEAVAPWLTVDSDPYPAVIDGRIQWILDGYTTTDRYPNSQRESFASMIDDSLQKDTGLQTVPTDEINYMRSAVKATVDAYDGTVTLYAWDESDPILQTWMDVFPGTVEPKSAIPDSLMQHLRYPEDLFKVQRYQLAKYHVTDPAQFFTGSNQWEVATDPNVTGTFQPPYRVFTPDGKWSMTSVFVPRGKSNVSAFASVDSDADSEEFGQIQLLEMSDDNTPAPSQVSNDMEQDDEVRSTLLSYVNSGTPPRYGNLLTLPVDNGLVYIEPVYAVKSNTSGAYPILRYVIVDYAGDVGIGSSLQEALADVLGEPVPDTNGGGNGGDQGGGKGGGEGNGGGPQLSLDQQIQDKLQQASDAFDRANDALAHNDLGQYQRQVEIARQRINEALQLQEQRDAQESPKSDAGD